jgi:signal transduction histidine kinase
LGEEINITIYRLVQESLNNIARHAQAHRVTVKVTSEMDKNGNNAFIVLRIEDDGVGFDTKESHAGTGLLGMRERAIAAGGLFYMVSIPGAGTRIELRIPKVRVSTVPNNWRLNDS